MQLFSRIVIESSFRPIIAFTAEGREQLQATAREAGATLVVTGTAMSSHLDQLLDQALAVD